MQEATQAKIKANKQNAITNTQSEHSLENRILNYILLFITCAFLGWIWEVSLHLLQHGQFVNRGVLHGPWLPIYGFGGLGIVLLLNHLREHPLIVFFAGAFGCGFMEYMTGWYLETFKHLKWWDYGDALFSIEGRVCLMSITCFGLCALAIIYYIYPRLTQLYNHLQIKPKKVLCLVLIFIFLADFVYSSDRPNTGEGITDNLSTTLRIPEASEASEAHEITKISQKITSPCLQ